MTIKELKDFIINARKKDTVKWVELAESLYNSCKFIKEDLFKKYQFRNSKTFEIVDISNVSKNVLNDLYKNFINILIRESHTLERFNRSVREPVFLSFFEEDAIKLLNRMSKSALEEMCDSYLSSVKKMTTLEKLLTLVNDTIAYSKNVLEELPDVVIYLTDDEKGFTFKGVLGEFYNSIYGSMVLDEPSEKTSEDYLIRIGKNRSYDRSVSEYYEKIGKCDF